jgi:hypothetical protein
LGYPSRDTGPRPNSPQLEVTLTSGLVARGHALRQAQFLGSSGCADEKPVFVITRTDDSMLVFPADALQSVRAVLPPLIPGGGPVRPDDVVGNEGSVPTTRSALEAARERSREVYAMVHGVAKEGGLPPVPPVDGRP